MSATKDTRLTLGPVLFNWALEDWLDFYARIADEAPVDTVVVGETVCAKRLPFFEEHIPTVMERLQNAGKEVVLGSLGLVMTERERQSITDLAAMDGITVEANDVSAVAALKGRPYHIGPMMNVYNEGTLAFYARQGATRVCLPPELPATSVAALAKAATPELEIQAFGRIPLAISARCYHARAHSLTKDGCQYVCAEDPDGMSVDTLADEPFLAVNGVQTMSHSYLNLAAEVEDIAAMGIKRLRLSPQKLDMVAVAATFRDLLDGKIDLDGADARLDELGQDVPFSNGFFHGREGRAFTAGSVMAE